MEPEQPTNRLAPLLDYIKTNPIVVVIVLGVLILVSLGSIVAMIRIQAEANGVLESATAQAMTEIAVVPTRQPTFTATPRPTVTATATATPTRTPTPTLIPSPTATPSPTPIVIDWRELGELQTLEVTTVTVFEDTNPRWWIVPDATILVRVTGQANFGIDITLAEIERLTESEGTAVRIVLPHATVTGVELVDAQVYDERWFPNAALGVGATQKALEDIETWAGDQASLLEIAEKLGKSELENFLRQLGFEEIEIVFE